MKTAGLPGRLRRTYVCSHARPPAAASGLRPHRSAARLQRAQETAQRRRPAHRHHGDRGRRPGRAGVGRGGGALGLLAVPTGGWPPGGRLDATIDLNPDYVYQSRGRLTPFGYEVEIRIPFKSLHYQSTDPQDWGLQIVREIQHTGSEDTWAPALRANASFLIQSGRLVGLTQLHRGLVMDATPEFTTKVNGAPETLNYTYKGEPDLGGTLRWGITENLGLSGTVNPDF